MNKSSKRNVRGANGKIPKLNFSIVICQTCYKEHIIQESNCMSLCPEEKLKPEKVCRVGQLDFLGERTRKLVLQIPMGSRSL